MSSAPNPYIGPRPFERKDSARFFGREAEVRRLRDNVLAHGVVLLYGASGTGKTSLLNTKLRETLEADGFQVLPIARVKGFVADGRYPDAVTNVFVYNLIAHLRGGEAGPNAGASLAQFLEDLQRNFDAFGERAPRVLIIDQLEELLTTHDEYSEHRKDFFRQVMAAETDPTLRILLSVREDYLATITQYADVFEGKEARLQLPPLTLRGALEAVTRPTAGTGRAYDQGVAEELVRNLSTKRIRTERGETLEVPGETVEPVQLQVVCQRLWDKTGSVLITMDELRQFGDVDAALRGFYEESVVAAVGESGVDERALRSWIGSNLITAADTRGMVIDDRASAQGALSEAVRVLESRHLVRAERRHGARWFELTHDRLIKPIQISNRFFEDRHRDGLEDPIRQARFLLKDRLTKCITLTRDQYRHITRYEDQIDWLGLRTESSALQWSPAELMLRSAIRLLAINDIAAVRADLEKWAGRVRSEPKALKAVDVPSGGEPFNREQLQLLAKCPESLDLHGARLAFVITSLLQNADDRQQDQIVDWTQKWKDERRRIDHG